MLIPNELSDRWETSEGKELLAQIISLIQKKDDSWYLLLHNFRGAQQIGNRKDLRYAPLRGVNFENAQLQEVRLDNAYLLFANLKKANLWRSCLREAVISEANLEGANLTSASMEGVQLVKSNLIEAKLIMAILDNANIEESNLTKADLRKANLRNANLSLTILDEAILSNANLTDANLEEARLHNTILTNSRCRNARLSAADFTKAILFGVDLTNSIFYKTKFSETNLAYISFGPEHLAAYDSSDTIICGRQDKILNWKKLSFIRKLPFFEVSWIGFTIALVIIFLTSKYNELIDSLNKPSDFAILLQHFKNLHAGAPHLIWLALFSSFYLLIGSIFYRLFCPSTIQEFSEEAWVSEHKQPRLIYFRESWSKHGWQWATLLTIVTGGLFLAFIVGERLVIVLSNFPFQMGFYLSISIGVLGAAFVIMKAIIHWDRIEEKCKKWFTKTGKN